jgi:hypothetical protein
MTKKEDLQELKNAEEHLVYASQDYFAAKMRVEQLREKIKRVS